jgi:uncharacterized protein YjbI with pentapeptide repeats
MQRADLFAARMEEVRGEDVKLKGAFLIDANLNRAKLVKPDFTCADLTKAKARGATLVGAVFNEAILDETDFTDTNLSGSSDFTLAKRRNRELTGAIMERAVLRGAIMVDADLTDANLKKADLTRANLTGAVMTKADLRGADFTGAVLDRVDLTGIRYDEKTVWPEKFTPPPIDPAIQYTAVDQRGSLVSQDDDWIEQTFTGMTLVGGLAELAGVNRADVERYEDAAPGRARFEQAVNDVLLDIFGPDSVEYTELEEDLSGSHMRTGRVHIKVRAWAWDVIKNSIALGVSTSLHDPGVVAPGMGLADTLRKALTLLSPAERDGVALVADHQRRGVTVSRDDLARFEIDVSSLVAKGVLADHGDQGLRIGLQ